MDMSQLSDSDLKAIQSGDLRMMSAQGLQAIAQAGSQPAQEPATKNRDAASQFGLGVRSTLKGVLSPVAMGADAIGGAMNAAQDAVLGKGGGYRFRQTLPNVDNLLDNLGIPKPDTAGQRIIGKAVETGAGAFTGAGLAGLASKGATGTAQAVLQRMAAAPGAQAVSGAAAGASGQQSAENGGGWGSQLLSSLIGGVAGAGAANLAKTGTAAVQRALTPATTPADIERTITIALQRQGIDPSTITPAMKQALMRDATDALKTGQGSLNAEALARLADYRRLGMTPTNGRITLDPYAVTQEQNAMKLAAATGARDAQLPQIAQGNNRTLLSAIEELRPVADRVGLGERAQAPIMARDASLQSNVNSLYSQARDSAGRSLPLEGGTFTRTANEALDQANVGSFLPPDIAKKMNAIAQGEIPLTVDVAEQLKTSLGNMSRNSSDGNVRTALKLVREALDRAPLQNDKLFNPSNAPAIPGTVPPSTAAAGQASIDAFNAARNAARQRFGWQEGTPAVARTLEGAAPDTFLQREIIGKSAAVSDVQKLAAEYSQSPEAMQAIRSGIVQHLKDAAIGKGNQTSTANFSGRQWLSAIDGIGERKLSVFFDKTEIEHLKSIGRVGSVETFQPRGSAVNNSNTAAGVGNMVMKTADALGPLLGKLPGGQALVRPMLDNITISSLERGARDVPRGLLLQAQKAPAKSGLLDAALLPYINGGLLSSISP